MTAPTHDRRFVVLRHDAIPEPHFDLMIESRPDGDLETWRSEVWPIRAGTPLTHLQPHRRAYLDYEGPISKNRGMVRRVEAGTCAVRIGADGLWRVEARSERGNFVLCLKCLKEPQWRGET